MPYILRGKNMWNFNKLYLLIGFNLHYTCRANCCVDCRQCGLNHTTS
jgi:hypothetical protein